MSTAIADIADTTRTGPLTRAAFSSLLRAQGGVSLYKVSEIDFGGREVVAYYRVSGPRGPRLLHDLAEAEDAFDREVERLVPAAGAERRARVA